MQIQQGEQHMNMHNRIIVPPPPCISYANVRNYYGPYAHCSLDKGVACAKHIQLPTKRAHAHGMGAP